MADRELLESAAKATGIELWHEDVFTTGLTQKVSDNGILRWNPLTNDGDALRLAVQLKTPMQFPDWENITRTWASKSNPDAFDELHKGDPYAATRRAITRAAAEIGSKEAAVKTCNTRAAQPEQVDCPPAAMWAHSARG